MDLTKRLGFSKDLLSAVAEVLEGNKIVHPNQKVISQAAPPHDEITAADFKALKAKKKYRVEGYDRNKRPYQSPIFESEDEVVSFYNKLRKSAPLTNLEIIVIEEIEQRNESYYSYLGPKFNDKNIPSHDDLVAQLKREKKAREERAAKEKNNNQQPDNALVAQLKREKLAKQQRNEEVEQVDEKITAADYEKEYEKRYYTPATDTRGEKKQKVAAAKQLARRGRGQITQRGYGSTKDPQNRMRIHDPYTIGAGPKGKLPEGVEVEQVDEKELNTANASAEREHDCAKHVVHEQWGTGQTISTMHAEPDNEGNIAWYDVMFEHGIEQEVPTDELTIVVSESHKHSFVKRKKMSEQSQTEIHGKNNRKKAPTKSNNPQIELNPETNKMSNEEYELEEGRKAGVVGLVLNNPKAKEHFTKLTGKEASYYHINKNPDHAQAALDHASKKADAPSGESEPGGDEDTEANKHPINQLRGIMDRGSGTFMGHKITRMHASKLVSQHDDLKPAQKYDFVANIGQHLKKVINN